MILIAVLTGLLLEKFVSTLEKYRRYKWFRNYANWLWAKLGSRVYWNGALGVIVTIALPLFLIWLTLYFLGEIHGIFSFTSGVLILVFSFGPGNFNKKVQNFLATRNIGDQEDTTWELDDILGTDFAGNELELTRAILESTLVQTNERLLAVLFWFIILGPIGALLLRLACLMRELTHQDRYAASEFAHAARRLHFILLWAPARLAALSYAISGSFVHCLDNWRSQTPQTVKDLSDSNEALLLRAGLGALQLGTHIAEQSKRQVDLNGIEAALSLTWRSVIVWVTVLAVITLTGWVG